MKQELFLTSSVHIVAHDISKKVNLNQANKLVFIDTAAEPEKSGDITWLENDRQALVDAGFKVADYTITGKTKEKLKVDLGEFDYIYLSGGNTAYLLDQSHKSGFMSLIKELVQEKGKVYIGTSAGSIIAGPKLSEYLDQIPELENRVGYGFVNFILVPHWGSKDFKEDYLGERLKIVYKKDQVPLLLLTDNQYVHVQGEQMEIVDVKD